MLVGLGSNDTNGQCIVAYKILLFALLHCTEWHNGAPMVPASPLGMHLPWWMCMMRWGSSILPEPSMWIITVTYHLIFSGKKDKKHCSPCTSSSFDARQVRRAMQQWGPAQLTQPCPHPGHTKLLSCILQ